MYICIYIYVYTYIYTYIRTYKNLSLITHTLIHTYVWIHTYTYPSLTPLCQHTSAYVSIRQHTSAYVSVPVPQTASWPSQTLWWASPISQPHSQLPFFFLKACFYIYVFCIVVSAVAILYIRFLYNGECGCDSITLTDVCWHMLTYIDVCWTYAGRMLDVR
jgi:hypothetical protein